MQKHWFYRLTSTVLALILVLQMVPVQSFAATSSNAGSTAVEPLEEQIPATIVGEVESLRNESQKHFRLSDGSFLAVNYGVDVHYRDGNGKWKEIDNRPNAVKNQAVLTAQNGDMITAYAATLSDGKILSTAYDNTSVSMKVLDTAQAAALTSDRINADSQAQLSNGLTYDRTASATIVQDAAAPEIIEAGSTSQAQGWTAEDLLPPGLSATVLYEDVYPGVDIQYTAYSHNIKEQIIVNQVQTAYRYDFLLEMSGVTAVANKDGSISLQTAGGKEMYAIPAPYMEDSAGAASDAVSYTLTPVTGGTVLTVEADAQWINAQERSFPVFIDPSIEVNTGNDNDDIYAAFSMEAAASTTTMGRQYLYVGNMPYNTNRGRYRLFMHFHKLPEIPKGAVVTEAKLQLYSFEFHKSGLTELPIIACDVTTEKPSTYSSYSAWFKKITWNNQPQWDDTNAVDYVIGNSTNGYRYWDLTELAKQWYYQGDHATIALVAEDESILTDDDYATVGFYAFASNKPPILTVSYRSNVGIEPHYTYATMGVGNAGTAYIADATGQLKVVKELASYASTVNPFSMNLVYNSDYFSHNAADTTQDATGYLPPTVLGTSMEMGQGWTLDVIQRMEQENIGGTNYLKYFDGDGTVHYFDDTEPNDTFYYDEDGRGLKVEVVSSGNYIMSDDNGNTWTFTNNLLTATADANENQILINYANGRITSIQQKNKNQTAIPVATFAYSGNVLQSVTDNAGNIYTLIYSNGKLTEIKMGGSAIAQYAYSDYRLTTLKDMESDYSIIASYDTSGKVAGYKERAGSSDGAQVSIIYENAGKTTYRDYGNNRTPNDDANNSDDIYTSYLFDYAGRTVNAYTTDASGKILGASNAVYTANQGTDRRNNRTLRSASIGVAAQQLLKNSSFEDTTATTWTMGTGASLASNTPRTGQYSVKLAPSSISVTASASGSTMPLESGKTYTISGYVNTMSTIFSGGSAYLTVSNAAGTVATSQNLRYRTVHSVEKGWVRLSCTFTAAADGIYTIGAHVTGATGTAYFDDFQVEEGEAPSVHNMVENGSMNLGSHAWTLGSSASYISTEEMATPSAVQIIGGASDDTTSIYQDIAINLRGSETFVLSGWVKANAAPDNLYSNADAAQDKYKQCGLRAIIYYLNDNNADTEDTEYHYTPFHTDLQEWQFTSLTIVPKQPSRTIEKIRVVCAYERNVNKAYFDDISLVREVAQTMKYDENGQLVSVTTTGISEDVNTYDEGNLIKAVTGGSGTYNYAYSDSNNEHLATAVTNGKITQSVEYDTFGNAIETNLFATPASDKDASGKIKTDADGNYLITEEPSGKFLQTAAEYSGDGNRTTKITDSTGASVNYVYENNNSAIPENERLISNAVSAMLGLPSKVTAPNGLETATVYDSLGRTKRIMVDGGGSVYYDYDKGMLKEMERHTGNKIQTYTLTYDAFGNNTSIKVGNLLLASYTYANKNGLLQTQTYGNGDSISFTYDMLGRVKTATYSDGTTATHTYTGNGQLHSILETKGSDSTLYLYSYDTLGRLIGSEEKRNSDSVLRTYHLYDENNRLKGQDWEMVNGSYYEGFVYNNDDGSLRTHETAAGHDIEYGYDDELRRLQTATVGDLYTRSYVYHEFENIPNRATTQVQELNYSGYTGAPEFAYEYDGMGNIEIYTVGGKELKYTYDSQGQLRTAQDDPTNPTYSYAYTYDAAGNLLTASDGTTTHTYTYGNSAWADLLTAFDGQSITYDASGNPTSYYNGTRWTFGWSRGRQLVSASDGTRTIGYTYSTDGLRTSKTVNNTTHQYIYAGGKLLRESYGYIVLDFFYDANGTPYAMKQGSVLYYYITNLQGDVIQLIDANGTVVANYEYDPYGKVISATGSKAAINPLRYRGYYYDTDSGLYYLQSRYYDPELGRFISPDTTDILTAALMELTDKNLFAYCDNNPIMRADNGGQFWNVIAGAFVGGGLELAGQLLSGKSLSEVDWAKVGVSAVSGGLTAAVGPVAGCLISGATDVAIDALDGNINSVADAAKSFAWGTAKAAASYGVGTAVGKATKSLTKIEKVGRLGEDGFPGIKYSYNKGQGRAVRSIELHPNHNNHGIHLQGNKWNPKTGNRGGDFFRWPRRG